VIVLILCVLVNGVHCSGQWRATVASILLDAMNPSSAADVGLSRLYEHRR